MPPGREPYRPASVRDRKAESCQHCGIELEGTVPVHDGGSHGRDFSGVPVCYRCIALDSGSLPSGPGYGPVPCRPAETPERVRELIHLLEYDGESRTGHPIRKTKAEFGDEEWEAIKELRDLGYRVTYNWDAPPDKGGNKIAFVYRHEGE